MKNSKVLVVVLSFLIMACGNTRETPSGLKFTVVKKGDGNVVKSDNFLVMDMVFMDAKDSVWNDTRKGDYPLIIAIREDEGNEEGIEEVFRMLSKGDSVTVKISAKSLFEKTWNQEVPPMVDAESDFTFQIAVRDILDSAGVMNYQQEMMAKENERGMKAQFEQLAKDTVIIDNYLREKGIAAQRTNSGIRYVITKMGTGNNAVQGQTVKINYAGYLLSTGKYFDTSIETIARQQGIFTEGRPYEPYELVAGQNTVIAGWEEALLMMNKGAKMTVYIPSGLAYGPRRRSEEIIENSILAFDMEMVDIK
ncbi:MAG: hypothetical protein HC811_05865 [Flammeovirgaceae bacterium]|nr:hypothetical protein [Flammeovirgaceae bacterium]